MINVSYDKKIYQEGLSIYQEIKRELSSLVEEANTLKSKSKNIESANAAFKYDGIYKETFDNIHQGISDLEFFLEQSSLVIKDAQNLVTEYSKGNIPDFVFTTMIIH